MCIKSLDLSKEDRGESVRIVKKRRDWRLRERAQTLLYFDAGRGAKAIAAQQELHLDTVYDWRKLWLAERLASLADKHLRCVPPNLTEALTARQFLTKLSCKIRQTFRNVKVRRQ